MPLFRKRKTYKRRPYKKRTYKRKYPRRKYGYKKRSYKRRRSVRPVFSKRQRSYLSSALRKNGDQDNVQIYRTLGSGTITSNTNEKNYEEFDFLSRQGIDDALRTYHEATQTGTGLTSMLLGSTVHAGGADNKNLRTRILSAYYEMKLRNNCTTPAELIIYHLGVKRRMGAADSPISEIEDGLSNSGAGTGSINDLRFSPYDSPTFLRYFKVLRTKKVHLKVGQEYKFTMQRRAPFTYNANDSVNHLASNFDPNFTQWCLIDARGCLGHSTPTNIVGVSPSSVDYTIMRQIKFANHSSKIKQRYLTSGDYLQALPTNPVHRQLVTEIQEHTCGIPNLEQVVVAAASAPSVVSALSSQTSKIDDLISAQEDTTQAIEDLAPGPPGPP